MPSSSPPPADAPSEPGASQTASSDDAGKLFGYGVSSRDDLAAVQAASALSEDAIAMQSGLLPLNANEEDDYAGADDVTRKVALCFLQVSIARGLPGTLTASSVTCTCGVAGLSTTPRLCTLLL